ncbi:MAG TPA: hypothetical protein VGO25_08605 [Rhodanobacteraceae bacterium]|jgi:hypothetical protein|nr:hypothetical protein [Rhodanobacteraceae bacterium]
MTTLSPAIRSGPLLAVAIAFAIATPASASNDVHHHFSIYGSLTPATTGASSSGTLQMKSHLSSATATSTAQTGGGLVLNAQLANSPLGCAGDTIFEDGFDP